MNLITNSPPNIIQTYICVFESMGWEFRIGNFPLKDESETFVVRVS